MEKSLKYVKLMSVEVLYNGAADWDGSLSLTLLHVLGGDIFMKGCSLQDIEA